MNIARGNIINSLHSIFVMKIIYYLDPRFGRISEIPG